MDSGDSESGHSGPPPPYESIVLSRAAVRPPRIPGPSESVVLGRPDIEIDVVDPVRQGEGVTAFWVYRVVTRTSLPQFGQPELAVFRRFRDFKWLHDRLAQRYRGVVLPPLPEKNAVQSKFQSDDRFIEARRRALMVFLNRVAAHPLLLQSDELKAFLCQQEDAWAFTVARTAGETSTTSTVVNNAMQFLRGWTHSAVNLVHGRSDDEQEDIEYLRFRDFVNILEGHTAEVHKQAGRLIRKEAKVLSVMKDLSDAAMGLAQFEKEPLKQCLGIAAARCTQLSSSLDSCVQEMDASLEAPLKESVRALREVRSTMEDRARALSNLSQAQGEVEVRRSRLTKLRSTPGVKQDRLIMAERELSVAQQTVEVQRGEYTAIVNKMGGELARFQRERSAELAQVMRNFAHMQLDMAREQVKAWETAVAELDPVVDHYHAELKAEGGDVPGLAAFPTPTHTEANGHASLHGEEGHANGFHANGAHANGVHA